MRRDFDATLKALVRGAAPALFPQLGLQDVPVEWLNSELPAYLRKADLIARLMSGAIVHLELQAVNDPWMAMRMLDYCVRIFQMTKVVPTQIVLYFGWKPMRMPAEIIGPDLRYRYRLLDIRRVDGAALLQSAIPEANALALLTQADPDVVVRRLRARLKHADDDSRERLKQFFLLLCSLRSPRRSEAWKMPITVDDILDSPVLRTRVKQEKEHALAEGISLGKAKGMTAILLAQLESRFGELPAATRAKVLKASPETLLQWSTRVLDAPTLQSVFRAAR